MNAQSHLEWSRILEACLTLARGAYLGDAAL